MEHIIIWFAFHVFPRFFPFLFSSNNISFFVLASFNCLAKFSMVSSSSNTFTSTCLSFIVPTNLDLVVSHTYTLKSLIYVSTFIFSFNSSFSWMTNIMLVCSHFCWCTTNSMGSMKEAMHSHLTKICCCNGSTYKDNDQIFTLWFFLVSSCSCWHVYQIYNMPFPFFFKYIAPHPLGQTIVSSMLAHQLSCVW